MSGRGRAPAPLLCGLHVELAPVGGGLNVDTGVAFRKKMATSLRTSHAIPRPVHRSICSCILTRPTLSSGSPWPGLPRMFSGRLNFSASRNQAGRGHLNDRLIDARLPLAQWTECSQPGKAVSTTERLYFLEGCSLVPQRFSFGRGADDLKSLITNMLQNTGNRVLCPRLATISG